MKIGVISSSVFQCPPPGYSGLEMVAYQCAKGLAAKGHQVLLFAPNGSECPGCEIVPIGPPGSWDEGRSYGGFNEDVEVEEEGQKKKQRRHIPGYWPRLLECDVICDHSWSKWAYMLKGEGRLKAPVLGVLHAPVKTMYSSLPPNVEKPCFVCISHDQANQFREIHEVDCRVCHNGIDTELYKPLDIPRSKRFLFLARFSTVKGPDLAIEACKKVSGRQTPLGEHCDVCDNGCDVPDGGCHNCGIGRSVGLDLVGDCSITNEPELLGRCIAMCDREQIVLRGPCNRGAAVWWFSQAHCLLHPNQRFREPLGLAPLEAMACGAPVIASDWGAMRETVKHGETGFLYPRSRGLEGLITCIKVLQEKTEHGMNVMRGNCRDWVNWFSVEKMVSRYEELCHEAVDGGGW